MLVFLYGPLQSAEVCGVQIHPP